MTYILRTADANAGAQKLAAGIVIVRCFYFAKTVYIRFYSV